MQEERGVSYRWNSFSRFKFSPLNHMTSCLDAEFPRLRLKVGLKLLGMESTFGQVSSPHGVSGNTHLTVYGRFALCRSRDQERQGVGYRY